jgi:hypothetical protein
MVEAFEHLYPPSGTGQIRRSHQAVVPAAHDDGVESVLTHQLTLSASVAFDLVSWAHPGLLRILPCVAQCPALPQQIPALVEGYLQRLQPLTFLGLVDLPALQFGPQLVLLGDESVNFGEDVLVFGHPASLPDYGWSGEYKT